MLNELQMEAVELIAKGHKQIEVATILGVDRKTVGAWQKKDEFKIELDRIMSKNRKAIELKLSNKGGNYINELEKIAFTGRSEKNRLDALCYLIDHVLGKSTTKVQDITNIETKEETNNTSWEELKTIELRQVK